MTAIGAELAGDLPVRTCRLLLPLALLLLLLGAVQAAGAVPAGPYLAGSQGGSCAISSAGNLYCWGRDGDGQISGQPSLPGGQTWVSVAASGKETCGISSVGGLYCWGDNKKGQAAVPGGYSWLAVDVGAQHACGLTTSNALLCWGENDHGETSVPPGQLWADVVAAGHLTCGATVARDVICWGAYNLPGGNYRPTSEYYSSLSPGQAAVVSTGTTHTCAIDYSSDLYCWGGNDYGQTSAPFLYGGETWVAVAASWNFTCGLTSVGAIRCFGDNTYGQLDVPGGRRWAGVATGGDHTCAIDDAANIECWGSNEDGALSTPALPAGETWALPAQAPLTSPPPPPAVFPPSPQAPLPRPPPQQPPRQPPAQQSGVQQPPAQQPKVQQPPATVEQPPGPDQQPPQPAAGQAGVSSSSNSPPVAAIAGGVIGALALGALLAGFFVWRRRRERAAAAAKHLPADSGGAWQWKDTHRQAPAVLMAGGSQAGSVLIYSSQQQPQGPDPDACASSISPDPTLSTLGGYGTSGGMPADPALASAPLLSLDPYVDSGPPKGRPGSALASFPVVLTPQTASAVPSTPDLGSAAAPGGGAQTPSLGGTSTGGSGARPGSSRHEEMVHAVAALWHIDFADIQVGRLVGRGSYGKVYAGSWNETPVAVKRLDDLGEILEAEGPEAGQAVLEALRAEAALMAACRHPNIVAFMAMCTDPPAIITEYCERGSLTDVLRSARADPAVLPWPRRLAMATEAAQGMYHLHCKSPPILHRDLKGPNLLVDAEWHVKVTDFNLSKMMLETAGTMSSGGGTLAKMNPRWLAPEVLRGGRASVASDVYAFGVVLWELLTFEIPWAAEPAYRIMMRVTEGGRPEVPPAAHVPGGGFAGLEAYVALMEACWQAEPYDRPESFSEIIAVLRGIPCS